MGLKRTPVAKVMDVLKFCPSTKGGTLWYPGPEASRKSRGEITRKFIWALYDVNEEVCTRNNPKKTPPIPQTTASIHSNARASSNLTGCGRIIFHIVGCKIRNAGNVVIVDSFVLIVRGPKTDSRSKSYGRLKILPRHLRGYPLVAWSGSIRKIPWRNHQKIYVGPLRC